MSRPIRGARLPIYNGESWEPYSTLVLVWCSMCERYIAHEERHGCELTPTEAKRRRVERVAKVRELMNR